MIVVALIHREDDAYGISFPDLPGCVSAAATLEDVVLNGKQALDLHLDGMVEDGDVIRELRTLDELKADPDFAAEFASAELVTLLPFDLPGRAVKVTITMEESLLQRLNTAAGRQGYTRSGFIADAVRQRLKG